MGEWDIDKLEAEMPPCMVIEWNEYLNFEIEQWVKAIIGAVPSVKGIEPSTVISDPAMKSAIFDKIGNINNGN